MQIFLLDGFSPGAVTVLVLSSVCLLHVSLTLRYRVQAACHTQLLGSSWLLSWQCPRLQEDVKDARWEFCLLVQPRRLVT